MKTSSNNPNRRKYSLNNKHLFKMARKKSFPKYKFLLKTNLKQSN